MKSDTAMDLERQAHVAFHLTGKRPTAGLETVEGLDLRPAHVARYRDLAALRYDFPLVLTRGGSGAAFVESLSGLVDRVLPEIAQGVGGERVRKQVLRLEGTIRSLVAHGGRGLLSSLWAAATESMGREAGADGLIRDSLDRARAALNIDGEIVDCDAALPARLLTHAWRVVQEEKADRLRAEVRLLAFRLSDILRANSAHSASGQSAGALRASVGSLDQAGFDFEAMSRVLTAVVPVATLADSRRLRIRSLVTVLEAHEFSPEAHVFTSCAAALGAYRVQLPKVIELARAMAMAELEIEGEYRESTHNALFAEFGGEGLRLDPQRLARFPDCLVCVNAGTMDPSEMATLMEILSAGLPMKMLVQSDDILDELIVGDGHLGFGMRSRQLTNMAIGLNEVYVLQSTSSHLFKARDQILRGLNHSGAALFSVFSGATGQAGDLPPYLAAAAAIESRAFPVFAYDPSAGANWASRFCLDANPQVDLDWPVQTLVYESEERQRVSEEVAFTLVDFVASDRRYAKHFARVPRAQWNDNMIPVSGWLAPRLGDPKGEREMVPCIFMVDRNNTLQKVLVDEKLVQEARRCREIWHSLQELGGIHNSHAERQLALERKARMEQDLREPDRATPVSQASPGEHAGTANAKTLLPEEAEERSPDEPFIETPRCTTCNECTQINRNMFHYNENRQAYIADPDAGSYAQLVEAAESCQVSIIHPGKPRHAGEAGLEELLKRAEVFR